MLVKIENVKVMNNFTVMMIFLVSHPAVQLSPPVPSALYELNAPILVGCGLEDIHSTSSDSRINTTQNMVCYQENINKWQESEKKIRWESVLYDKNDKPQLR